MNYNNWSVFEIIAYLDKCRQDDYPMHVEYDHGVVKLIEGE